jgi:glutathione S-transferase
MSGTALAAPTKPTLYHCKYWSSSRPAGVLLELGVAGTPGAPVDIVDVTGEQVKTDPMLCKLNPQRRLPLFRDADAGLVLTESGGLVQYLLERYDVEHALHPAVGDPTRADFLQLLHFGPATAYHVSVPIMFKGGPPQGIEALRTSADVFEQKKREWHEVVAPTLEQALDKFGGPFLLGAKFTAADIACGYDVVTASFAGVPELFDAHPKVKAYHEALSKRPVYATLYA